MYLDLPHAIVIVYSLGFLSVSGSDTVTSVLLFALLLLVKFLVMSDLKRMNMMDGKKTQSTSPCICQRDVTLPIVLWKKSLKTLYQLSLSC